MQSSNASLAVGLFQGFDIVAIVFAQGIWPVFAAFAVVLASFLLLNLRKQRIPVKLGTKLFYEDDDVIDVCHLQEGARVVDADCVAFGARLAKGEFKRLRVLNLVRFSRFCFCRIFGACFVALKVVV